MDIGFPARNKRRGFLRGFPVDFFYTYLRRKCTQQIQIKSLQKSMQKSPPVFVPPKREIHAKIHKKIHGQKTQQSTQEATRRSMQQVMAALGPSGVGGCRLASTTTQENKHEYFSECFPWIFDLLGLLPTVWPDADISCAT
jgi:hypothetical protein